MNQGRNEPCPCGSGKKYKHCCLRTGGPEKNKRSKQIAMAVTAVLVLGLLLALAVSQQVGMLVGVAGLAGVGLWIWMTEPPSSSGGSDPSAINFGR